ncbi:hypothetical protein TYRP_021572 [Tyrophagus putrescentiae]|nr:hypothetical protein TYRP_021572 [Tyrophagus putrescentiae]
MTSGMMVIDLSPESKDPCKNFMIDFMKCSQGKSKEDRDRECFHLGSTYLDCRTNPKNFKIDTKKTSPFAKH